MAFTINKLGAGTLTFGEEGTATDFSANVTKCILTPSIDEGDSIMVLSGDEYADGGTVTWELEVTMPDSYGFKNSKAVWLKENAGKTLPFTFVPAADIQDTEDKPLKVTGKVLIQPIAIGGDVGKANQNDVTLKCVGQINFSEQAEAA